MEQTLDNLMLIKLIIILIKSDDLVNLFLKGYAKIDENGRFFYKLLLLKGIELKVLIYLRKGLFLSEEEKANGVDEKREHNRTPFNARVKITHSDQGEFLYLTRDISDAGIFVCVDADQDFPALGSCVKVQMQGLPVPAPVLDMVIVRKGKDGYGLNFINKDEDTD